MLGSMYIKGVLGCVLRDILRGQRVYYCSDCIADLVGWFHHMWRECVRGYIVVITDLMVWFRFLVTPCARETIPIASTDRRPVMVEREG